MPVEDSAPVATALRLRKTYGGVVAVDDVDLSIGRGEIFGFIGPNGSGKTTTVECLQGLRTPDSGSISILGLDPFRDRTAVRARVGCQLQESALPHRLKVWEVMDLFSTFVADPDDWSRLIVDWGLGTKRNAAFADLSGGQRQRLFIALALLNKPEVVFLDEMTTGLDPAARHVAWDLIERLRDRGTTVVLVTHFMDEAEHLCDRVAIMDKGRIIACDSPPGLVASHAPGTLVTFTTDVADLSWLREVSGVTSVSHHGRRVQIEGTGPILVRCATALAAHGIEPEDLTGRRSSLEEVYLALVGKRPVPDEEDQVLG